MKNSKLILPLLAATGLFGAVQVQAQSFPIVPLSVEGRFSYNTNEVLDTSITSLRSFTANFNTRDLVGMLASSAAVSNVVKDVTGFNGFPRGTTLMIVANFSHLDVIAVARNGFSFPLAGNDPVTGQDYSFVSLAGALPIASTFNKSTTTQAGSEHDRLTVNFLFDDAAGDSFSITSVAQIDWRASKVKNGAQNVEVEFDVFGGGTGYFNGYPSTVEADASGDGDGNENVVDAQFPFWIWFELAQQPLVNT